MNLCHQGLGEPTSAYVRPIRPLTPACRVSTQHSLTRCAPGRLPCLSLSHANAELFDPEAEYAFSYLQVFSAICVIFAHGR